MKHQKRIMVYGTTSTHTNALLSAQGKKSCEFIGTYWVLSWSRSNEYIRWQSFEWKRWNKTERKTWDGGKSGQAEEKEIQVLGKLNENHGKSNKKQTNKNDWQNCTD